MKSAMSAGRYASSLGLVLLVVVTVFGAFALTLQDQPRLNIAPPTSLVIVSLASPTLPGIAFPLATATPGRTALPTELPASPTPDCGPPPNWKVVRLAEESALLHLALDYGTTVQRIQRANCLEDLKVAQGKTLYLPPTRTPTRTATSTLTSTPTSTSTATATLRPLPTRTATRVILRPTRTPCGPPRGWVRYTVQRGETMFSLARRSGTTVAQVQRANCLNGPTVYAGVPIWLPRIPTTVTPLPPTSTPAPESPTPAG